MKEPHIEVTITQEKDSNTLAWFVIGICTGLIFIMVVGMKIGSHFQQKQLQEMHSK